MDINAPKQIAKTGIEIYCCYTPEDQISLIELKKHLMPLQLKEPVSFWSDMDIRGGAAPKEEIYHHLHTANIILLLVSTAFIADEERYSTEVAQAMERYKRGEVKVIPIILHPCAWEHTSFSEIQELPKKREL